jgi:hypothetical protein
MKTNTHFLKSYLAQFFLGWEMFQTKVAEKIKMHILFSVTFFFENRAVYHVMWKNTIQPGSPQKTIWRLRVNAEYPGLHTHTHTHTHFRDMRYLLPYHYNNGCKNAPHCYVVYIGCLVFLTCICLRRGLFRVTLEISRTAP